MRKKLFNVAAAVVVAGGTNIPQQSVFARLRDIVQILRPPGVAFFMDAGSFCGHFLGRPGRRMAPIVGTGRNGK